MDESADTARHRGGIHTQCISSRQLWQGNLISGAEHASAGAYIAHLKDENARKQVAGEANSPIGKN
jgi:hypothetical protein